MPLRTAAATGIELISRIRGKGKPEGDIARGKIEVLVEFHDGAYHVIGSSRRECAATPRIGRRPIDSVTSAAPHGADAQEMEDLP